MDADGDGLATRDELKSFTVGERVRDLRKDTEKQWKYYGLGPGEKLTFERYAKKTYPKEEKFGHSSKTKEQERRRFHVSDANNDGALDKEEFMAFEYAEEYPHMHDIVMLETMEDMDKNGDGVLNFAEFTDDEEGMEEGPEAEKTFKQFDKDGDGQLSRAEVKQWILGPSSEAAQEDEDSVSIVLANMDKDKDGKLSREEIAADSKMIEDQLMYEEEEYTHDEF
ncbi:calumenin-A-like [Branchiostoma floridae]|uniref:Calumenin-A-like n=1 Tax=Branchiostoma floridae TaxID=7739 RepID=A0A9J7MPV9_BRAFL|nr:calumenin-A-like [Branchiostoma floridae]